MIKELQGKLQRFSTVLTVLRQLPLPFPELSRRSDLIIYGATIVKKSD